MEGSMVDVPEPGTSTALKDWESRATGNPYMSPLTELVFLL